MRSISRVGVLLLGLVAGQAWAECGIGDADAVVSDAGQGNFSCANYSTAANGPYELVLLEVTYENPNNPREVDRWEALPVGTEPPRQPDILIGVAGNGSRCVWEYNNAQLAGGDPNYDPITGADVDPPSGLSLDGNKAFQDLFGCTDGVEQEPPVVPVTPIDTATDSCDIDVTVDGSPVAGAISGVAFGPDTLAVCTIGEELQFPCVSFCRERPLPLPASCASATPDVNGNLPYQCRRCEAAKDFPNEQGLPYCVEYVNSYCEEASDPGCLEYLPDPSAFLDTFKPRAVGETTVVVSQEYKSSECGLISVTLGGRQYSRWVPCQ